MKASHLQESLQQAIARRDVFLLLSFGLLLVVLLMSWTLYQEIGSTRIVLVPTTMTQVGWLDKRGVSSSYLVDMARYMSGLLLNASAENSDYRRQHILRFTASQDRGALKAYLLKQQRMLKVQDVSTVFFPTQFTPDTSRLVVTVEGILHRYVGKKGLAPLKKRYQIQFRYQQGLLVVSQFNEISQH